MIAFVKGDATLPQGSGPKIIAHCCNNLGVWGAGFVLALSKKWNAPEAEYRRWAKENPDGLPLGGVQFVPIPREPDLTVANIIGQFNTVAHAGVPPIRYQALWRGLDGVGIKARELGASVHLPRLGCGLAGGVWDKVEPLILDTLCRRGIKTIVYDWP